MKDDNKTKKQLVSELTELRSQNAELKKSISRSISVDPAVEETLRYAESIVETVREPLLVLDKELKIISANRNFYRTFKTTPDETIGSFIYDLGNKQWDIPKLRELLEEILPEKQEFDDFEVTHDFQSLGQKVMLINARQIYRKGIGTKMILLAIEDITERKRVEDLLAEDEWRYRRVYETASDGIVLFDKLEGKITHANPAIETMLGYTEKEIIGKKLQDIGVMFDLDDFKETMQILNEIGITHYADIPIKTKSGQHIDTDIYLADRAKSVQCNVRDISERKRAQYELSESDKRYHMLFDAIDEGFCIIEVIFDENEKPIDYRFLEINPSFENQTGLIDARGKRMRELAPKHEEHWFEIYGKIALTGEPVRFVSHAGQLHRWYDVYAFRMGQPEDRQVAILFNDITELKRTDEALRESETRYRGLFEDNHAIMLLVDPDNGAIIDANDAASTYYGWSIEELKRRRIDEINTLKREEVFAEMQLALSEERNYFFFRHRRADGTIRDVEVYSGPIPLKGKTVLYSIVHDVTERKRAEEEIREYSENLERMVEERMKELNRALYDSQEARDRIDGILKSVADGLIVTDLHNRVIVMNRAAEDLLNVRLSDVIGRSIDYAISDDTLRERIRTTLDKKKPGYQFDFELPGEDDASARIMRARTSVIENIDGKYTGIITIIQDVTYEREVDRMKTEFLSTAAHELRSPLTSIEGFSELLMSRDDITDEERGRFLSHINRQSRNLAAIISDLLDISRIESGRGVALNKVPAYIEKIVKDAASYFESVSAVHRFAMDFPAETVELMIDPEKMEQVLGNIFSNAVKYSPGGGVIKIVGELSGDHYQVSVEDKGIGMTPEQVEKIFDKFYRADSSSTAVTGTGLGMSIVKHIVEAHGGTVSVESEPEKGTTVRFTVPGIRNKEKT